jgi:transcriptional regulator GlxA family with amidase domain
MASGPQHTRTVGIYIYDGVEVLDLAGPFEVFSDAALVAARLNPGAAPPFRVFTLAATGAAVTAGGGLIVEPQFTIAAHPPLDVLVVPGGAVEAELGRSDVIAWVAATHPTAQITVSVCTGAFLLGEAGLLAGKSATTHWDDIAELGRMFPDTRVVDDARWVDEGSVVTAAGISAGLDVSLHLVAQLAGDDLARETARYMDYRWRSDPRDDGEPGT